MPGRIRRICALTVVLIAGLMPQVAAAERESLEATIRARGADAAREFAASLLEGSLAERVEAVARADGFVPSGEAAAPRARAAGVDAALETVPPFLAASVSRLLDATSRAEALRNEAFHGVSPAEALARVEAASTTEPVRVVASTAPIPEPVAGAARAVARPSIPDGVDMGRIAAAAVLIAGAIDRELPALRKSAAEGPKAPLGGPPSINMCPNFAIDYAGDTEYPADCRLIVDLVGNDTYSAGAGHGTLTNPVSVVVDVTGNDTYRRIDQADVLNGQAVGTTGVGALVDVVGDDLYEVRDERGVPDLTPAKTVIVRAQGAGVLGAGILADGGGRDRFIAIGSTGGGQASVAAQGAGQLGIGLLVHGPGTATYTAQAESKLLKVFQDANNTIYEIGAGLAAGQGAGEAGAGAIADVFGPTDYNLSAKGAFAIAVGQGGGSTGAGIAADGGGLDEWDLEAIGDVTLNLTIMAVCPAGFLCDRSVTTSVITNRTEVLGQGAAAAGAGVHVDFGIDPSYRNATAISKTRAIAVVVASGGGGTHRNYTATATARNGPALVRAHGAADTGAGVAIGGLGLDSYHAVARSEANAVATASGAQVNTATATATGGNAIVNGQGYTRTGAGILADPAGNDLYLIEESATATAVQSGLPGTSTAGTVQTSGRAFAGPGVGLLVDAGGTDTYSPLPSGVGDPGTNDRCWTNNPPGLPNLNISTGMDVDGGAGLSPTCMPPPN